MKVKAFLFAPESPRILAVIRIGLSGLLLFDFLPVQPYLVEFFSSAGQPLPMDPNGWFQPPILSPAHAAMMFGLLQFALLSAAIGWQTRVSLVASGVLTAWFGLLDGVLTITKYRVIGIHLFFLLACSECGAVWSVDRLLSADRGRLIRLGPAWPRRLIQMLVCSIYLGAACAKLHVGDFVSGDQIVFSLLYSGMTTGRYSMWLALHPLWAAQASIATLVFECSFPLLIWVRRVRPLMLVAAAAFHLGIACLMSLNVFSYVMLVAVLAFIDERDLIPIRRGIHTACETLRQWMGRQAAEAPATSALPQLAPFEPAPSRLIVRWKSPISLAAYVLLATAAAGLSFAWDRGHDRYAVYHTPPVPALQAVSLDSVEAMLSGQPAPVEDYFHRMEIGSRPGGRHVFGETRKFRTGMTVFVCVRLLIPHPEFVAQLELVGPDGKTYARQRLQAAELMSHVTANIPLGNNLPAGEFQLHWIANGEDIYQRSIEVQTRSANMTE